MGFSSLLAHDVLACGGNAAECKPLVDGHDHDDVPIVVSAANKQPAAPTVDNPSAREQAVHLPKLKMAVLIHVLPDYTGGGYVGGK